MEPEEEEEEAAPPDPSSFGVYYARLLHQQNMLQDGVRTEAYRRAILSNAVDFEGKVVLDVGSGTGILSFFAAQAGAARVYSVEASNMADQAARLVAANGYGGEGRVLYEKAVPSSLLQSPSPPKIVVVKGRVEDVELPERVDIIVSEPLGFFLVHERMLEALVIARKRFLKAQGKIFPSSASLFVVPLTDPVLWNEQAAKASFWRSCDFYRVDLSSLESQALDEYFGQAAVGYFSSDSQLCDTPCVKHFDFSTLTLRQLREFSIPLDFVASTTNLCHGLGCWFDAHFFAGSTQKTTLSTSPSQPGTHWYQCKLLFRRPLALNASQRIVGSLRAAVNDRLSYDLDIQLKLDGTDIATTQIVRLDDQMYHYLQTQ